MLVVRRAASAASAAATAAAEAARGRVEPALLDALAQLVHALGVDASKQLHYALCGATRAEAVPARRAAMRGLARLYAVLKQHALTHVPEAVPFVAELVEDGDLEVRKEALALMRSLEDLAGEELMR